MIIDILIKFFGYQYFQTFLKRRWNNALGRHFEIGGATFLNGASLTVREPAGCSLIIGESSHLQCHIVFEKGGAVISIGSRTHLGGDTLIDAATSIEIGDDVLIAFNVMITDHNSHALSFSKRKDDVKEWMRGKKDWLSVKKEKVIIKDKSWIGAHSIILKGVTVSEGAIVGAGSVVTKDVPPWSIVAGNPARVIRKIPLEER